MSKGYKVGKIQADNVAVGDHARAEYLASADPTQTAMQAEALYQIRQLIELLSIHANEINSFQAVQADAKSVEAALKKKTLNRARIENLIGKMTPALAGVTALANAIDAVRAAVSHLPM